MNRSERVELAFTDDLALASYLTISGLDPEISTDHETRKVYFGFTPDQEYQKLFVRYHKNPMVPLTTFVSTYGRLKRLALNFKYGHPGMRG